MGFSSVRELWLRFALLRDLGQIITAWKLRSIITSHMESVEPPFRLVLRLVARVAHVLEQ